MQKLLPAHREKPSGDGGVETKCGKRKSGGKIGDKATLGVLLEAEQKALEKRLLTRTARTRQKQCRKPAEDGSATGNMSRNLKNS
jgi:hypothetical protein